MIAEGRWERVGRELRNCDPARFVAVLRVVEDMVNVYREDCDLCGAPKARARNDNS